jgi:hypothetical protein
MGRRPTRLTLWGVAASDDAQSFLDKLEAKFREGKPVPFTADIVADANIEQMVIDDLDVQAVAGKPQSYAYVITLREYIEPVEPAEPAGLDTDILDDATKLIEDMVPGLDIGLDFATGLEKFVTPLTDFLARLQKFNSSGG